MARFKARKLGLAAVVVLAIGIALLAFWQNHLLTAEAAEEDSTYIVQSGDSVVSIADKLGVSATALAAANKLQVTDFLFRNQVLTVPAEGDSSEMSDAATDAVRPARQLPATSRMIRQQPKPPRKAKK